MSYQLMHSIGKDPAIKDLSKDSIPGHAPTGFRSLQPGEKGQDIGSAAARILNTSELGDQTPFTVEGQLYMGRTEPHFHPPPPPGTDPSEYGKYPKPWGWHKGVTVFKAKEDTTVPTSPVENFVPPSNSQTRMKLLQRVQDSPELERVEKFLSDIEKGL
jgi:hypothetical protein